MFFKTQIRDHIRVAPAQFSLPIEQAIIKEAKAKYDGHISPELGIVIDIAKVLEIRQGVVLPGDGSAFYSADLELLVFRPELHEVVLGRVRDIADFGAFITLGPIDGMVHIGQTMEDFVSFTKEKTLVGRDSKRTLKIGDLCKARVIAISLRDPLNPKIGLTMRQPGLGKLEWIAEDLGQRK